MNKTFKNNVISGTIGALAFVVILALAPTHAFAQYAGGYNSGHSYGTGYSSYGSSYSNGYQGYNNHSGYGSQGYGYTPIPSSLYLPTAQVVYANGYYANYFVPTVTYFPPQQSYYQPTPTYNYGGYGSYGSGYGNTYNYGGYGSYGSGYGNTYNYGGYGNYGNGGYGTGGYNNGYYGSGHNTIPGNTCYASHGQSASNQYCM